MKNTVEKRIIICMDPRPLMAASMFVSKDEIKPALNMVYVECEKDGIRFTGTNGHYLISILQNKIAVPEDLIGKTCMISPLPKIDLKLRKVREHDFVFILRGKEISCIEYRGHSFLSGVTYQLLNHKAIDPNMNYPDYKSCIPKEFKEIGLIGLNVDVLKPFQQATKRLGLYAGTIELKFTDSTRAINVRFTECNYPHDALFMPVRLM